MAKLSVVILNFNGLSFLEKFLPTVIKYSNPYEVVVADNNSNDESIPFLKKRFPDIRLIELDQNYGFCKGYNKALKQIKSDFYVILNSDIEVTKNWLDPVLKLLDSDNSIAAVQPKLLDYNHRNKFEYAGGSGGFMDKYGYPFCRGRIFDTIEIDEGQYNKNSEIFWATGACFCIRADLFHRYGGFDEDFFAHMEEIDLCWRMKQDGHKVYYCSESTVYHVGGGTLQYKNPKKTYLNFRNSLMVLIKNLPAKELCWKLPLRWVIDYVAAIKFLIDGSVQDSKMVLKAHIYIWKNALKTIKKRKNIKYSIKDLEGVYPKLLLFTYHFDRVRKFKDLKF